MYLNSTRMCIAFGALALLAGDVRSQGQGIQPLPDPKIKFAVPGEIKPAVVNEENPAVHRMVIFNGPSRSVHFVGSNLSPSELASLKELEVAQSELALIEKLQDFRMDFLNSQLRFDQDRQQLKERLVNYVLSAPVPQAVPGPATFANNVPTLSTFLNNPNYSLFNGSLLSAYTDAIRLGVGVNNTLPFVPPGLIGPGNGNNQTPFVPIVLGGSPLTTGFAGGGFGYPYGYGVPFGFGGGFPEGPVYPPANYTPYSPQQNTTGAANLLATLIQDDGNRSNLGRSILNAPSPVNPEKARDAYAAALSKVAQSDTLRTALGGPPKSKASVTLAGIPDVNLGAPVTVNFKVDNKTETVEGNLLRDDPSWLVVRTAQGRLSIPKAQIQSVLVKD